MFCDIEAAFKTLTAAMKDVLERKYGLGEELSEAKDRQQATRGVKKLWVALIVGTDQKAKAHQGPGSRKVVTNASAQVKTKSQVDD